MIAPSSSCALVGRMMEVRAGFAAGSGFIWVNLHKTSRFGAPVHGILQDQTPT